MPGPQRRQHGGDRARAASRRGRARRRHAGYCERAARAAERQSQRNNANSPPARRWVAMAARARGRGGQGGRRSARTNKRSARRKRRSEEEAAASSWLAGGARGGGRRQHMPKRPEADDSVRSLELMTVAGDGMTYARGNRAWLAAANDRRARRRAAARAQPGGGAQEQHPRGRSRRRACRPQANKSSDVAMARRSACHTAATRTDGSSPITYEVSDARTRRFDGWRRRPVAVPTIRRCAFIFRHFRPSAPQADVRATAVKVQGDSGPGGGSAAGGADCAGREGGRGQHRGAQANVSARGRRDQ